LRDPSRCAQTTHVGSISERIIMDLSAHLRARSGAFAISSGAVLWGTTGVVMHAVHAHTGLAAVSIGCYRLLVAAVVLAAMRGRDMLRLARTAGLRRGVPLVASGAGLGVYQALYFVGVQEAGVSLATLISIGTAPVVLTVASAVAGGRRPSVTAIGTVACAVGGLALISFSTGSASGPHPLAGIVAAFGSGLTYAGCTALNRRQAGLADPLTLIGAASLVGTLTLLPVSLASGMAFVADRPTVSALLYLGVVPTALGYGLFFGGLRSTPYEVAAVLTLLEPLAATLLAAALLGETLSSAATVGAALLLLAVAGLYVRPVLS
jgi:DME family drug/metabolite transporter